MRGLNLETIKQYVQMDFGIAIVPTIAISGPGNSSLRVVEISRVFEPTIVSLIVQDDLPTLRYVADLIDLVAPRKNNTRQIRDLARVVPSS